MAIELADEHEPAAVVTGLMSVIANMLADSRRGWVCHGSEVYEVSVPTDSGFDVIIRLTINFQ